MAGEAAVAVGLGALVEEEYLAQRVNELIQPYRRLRELRRRMLQEVEEKAGESVAEIASNIAAAVSASPRRQKVSSTYERRLSRRLEVGSNL
jgi:hypothetical protein